VGAIAAGVATGIAVGATGGTLAESIAAGAGATVGGLVGQGLGAAVGTLAGNPLAGAIAGGTIGSTLGAIAGQYVGQLASDAINPTTITPEVPVGSNSVLYIFTFFEYRVPDTTPFYSFSRVIQGPVTAIFLKLENIIWEIEGLEIQYG
jgi:hypothetical protein